MSEKETEESSMNHCFPERTGAPMAIDTNTHIRSRAKDTHKHTHTHKTEVIVIFFCTRMQVKTHRFAPN